VATWGKTILLEAGMEIKRLSWLGIRTEKFEEMTSFLEHALGLRKEIAESGRTMFRLPIGDPIDVFDSADERYLHFTTGPVVGFLVDDVEAASAELEAAGGELIGPVQRGDGFMWAHFRAPDGNLYELQGKDPAAGD
jgi:predicted enzyme related to lactoylglutathione lyase